MPHSPAPTPPLLKRITATAARAGLDWFILALAAAILLARVWPEPGIQEGLLSLESVATAGVSVIFFFYGLKLKPEQLRAGLSNWRLHLVVQLSTFVLFPLLVMPVRGLFGTEEGALLWLGIFYLAALPSTVSSSVVMVSIAGGNIPAAIFNASVSSLAGVFLTPVWMSLVLEAGSGGADLTGVIMKLMLQVIVPVVLGLLLHRFWGDLAVRNSKRLRYFDQLIILLIVYTSFCESFHNRLFEGFGLGLLLWLGLGMIGLFGLVYLLIQLVCRLLRFSEADTVAATFCGSKKSLVHGTVMSKVLFARLPAAGVLLLPLMLYHALQLIAASIIAQARARRNADKPVG